MKVQTRYRSMIPAALAIFSLTLLGFVGTAAAAAGGNGGTAGKSGDAPGQVKKDDAAPTDTSTTADSSSSSSTDSPANANSVHDANNGPGGQVCDGDPNNAPGAGGVYENTCPAGP